MSTSTRRAQWQADHQAAINAGGKPTCIIRWCSFSCAATVPDNVQRHMHSSEDQDHKDWYDNLNGRVFPLHQVPCMTQAERQRRQALNDASDEDEDEAEDENNEDEGEEEGGEEAEEAEAGDEDEAMTDDQGTVSGVVLFTKEHADNLEERADYGEKLVRLLKAAGATSQSISTAITAMENGTSARDAFKLL